MSGWIPLEKDLLTDPKFRRLVDAYHEQQHLQLELDGGLPTYTHVDYAEANDVTQGRYTCNGCAYRVLGMLAGLWMYADTHIHDDDTLEVSPRELGLLLGWSDFVPCVEVCSRGQWLRRTDDPFVLHLPDYQAHNGMEAKERKMTAKRVQRHRKRHGVTGVTQERYIDEHERKRNGSALPDQTKPHQTKEEKSIAIAMPKKPRQPNGHRLPEDFVLTPERASVAKTERLTDPGRTFDRFRDHWRSASGANARKLDWDAAWRNWCRKEADLQKPNGSTAPFARPTRMTQESAQAAIDAAFADVRDSEDNNYMRVGEDRIKYDT